MNRQKIAEIVFEKVSLASVAAIVLLLFQYYVNIQQDINKAVLENTVAGTKFVERVDQSRNAIALELSNLKDQSSDFGLIKNSGSKLTKALRKAQLSIAKEKAVLSGMSTAFRKYAKSAPETQEFGVKTMGLLTTIDQRITDLINSVTTNSGNEQAAVDDFQSAIDQKFPDVYEFSQPT